MSEAATDSDTIFVSPTLKFGQARVDSRPAKAKRDENPLQAGLFTNGAPKRARLRKPSLTGEDNTPEGLQALLAANRYYRAEWRGLNLTIELLTGCTWEMHVIYPGSPIVRSTWWLPPHHTGLSSNTHMGMQARWATSMTMSTSSRS